MIPDRLWPTYVLALRDLSTLKVDNAAPCLILPDDVETRRKNLRVEAWLRGFISFTDLCTLNRWEAAERRQTLEGLGVTLPEWNERPPAPQRPDARGITPGHECGVGHTCNQPGCINCAPASDAAVCEGCGQYWCCCPKKERQD